MSADKLAHVLSKASSKHDHKLEYTFDNMSIEELEQFLFDGGQEKTASVKEDPIIELVKMADSWGRELARNMTKEALVGAVSKGVGSAIKAVTESSGAKRALTGAAAGTLGGALTTPGIDQYTGQPKSRLGNMAAGAAIGGMAGYGAKGVAEKVLAHKGAVGDYARKAVADAAKE